MFEGLHFFDVGWAVMRGDFVQLRRALVPLSQRVASMAEEELEQWLRGKLQPVATGNFFFTKPKTNP